MPYPAVVFPDAAAVVLSAIGDQLVVDTVGTVPTDRTLDSTFVYCRRVGGPQRDTVVDDASLSLEAWAPSPAAAHDLLQDARAVLHSLTGTVVHGVPVYRVQEFAGPAYLPDPESGHPRYVMTAAVSLRGSPLEGS